MMARTSVAETVARWDGIVKIVQVIGTILLAIITYFQVVNGRKASEAAVAAQYTARVVARVDSIQGDVLDTIHTIVNNERTKLKKDNENLLDSNERMREQLIKAGLKPIKEGEGQRERTQCNGQPC